MVAISTWTELLVIVSLCTIPPTFSGSFPLQHRGLLSRQNSPSPSPKEPSVFKTSKQATKVLKVPKKMFKKFQEQFDEEAGSSKTAIASLSSPSPRPASQAQLQNSIVPSVPHRAVNSSKAELGRKNVPYYDCPPYERGDEDGNNQAIIKADPFDCTCYYYCSWGVHYVQCCSWPLLWNDSIKTCDWYWLTKCSTYGSS